MYIYVSLQHHKVINLRGLLLRWRSKQIFTANNGHVVASVLLAPRPPRLSLHPGVILSARRAHPPTRRPALILDGSIIDALERKWLDSLWCLAGNGNESSSGGQLERGYQVSNGELKCLRIHNKCIKTDLRPRKSTDCPFLLNDVWQHFYCPLSVTLILRRGRGKSQRAPTLIKAF